MEARREDVVADLSDHGVAVDADRLEISPPFGERPVAFSNSMQPDAGYVVANRQGTFDNIVCEPIVPVVEGEKALPYKTVAERQTAHAADPIAGLVLLNHAFLNAGMIRRHIVEVPHDLPHLFYRRVDHMTDVNRIWHAFPPALEAEPFEISRLAGNRLLARKPLH